MQGAHHMPITDWPAAERPREKLLSQGAGALSDAELLAIFLRTGVPGCSAVDLARQLLSSFGSRSEEHTSELQSRPHLVCRLLLEKKKSPSLALTRTSSHIYSRLTTRLTAHNLHVVRR